MLARQTQRRLFTVICVVNFHFSLVYGAGFEITVPTNTDEATLALARTGPPPPVTPGFTMYIYKANIGTYYGFFGHKPTVSQCIDSNEEIVFFVLPETRHDLSVKPDHLEKFHKIANRLFKGITTILLGVVGMTDSSEAEERFNDLIEALTGQPGKVDKIRMFGVKGFAKPFHNKLGVPYRQIQNRELKQHFRGV